MTTTPAEPPPPIAPRTFRMAPAMRARIKAIAASLMLVFVLTALLPWASNLLQLPEPPNARKPPPYAWIVHLGCQFALALGAWLVLSYRLQIDDLGVTRRVWRFSYHWPWHLFESSPVDWVEYRGCTFAVQPGRKLSQILSLDRLSDSDRLSVLDTILSRWIPPPVNPPPDSLTLRTGKRSRLRLRLDPDGLTIHEPRAPDRRYSWSDVRRLQITRAVRPKRDYQRLAISLPDRRISLRLVGANNHMLPNWKALAPRATPPTPSSILSLILKHVPDSRCVLRASTTPPATRHETRLRLALNRLEARRLRKLRQYMLNFPILCFTLWLIYILLMMAFRYGLADVLAWLDSHWPTATGRLLIVTAFFSIYTLIICLPISLVDRHFQNEEHRRLIAHALEMGWPTSAQ